MDHSLLCWDKIYFNLIYSNSHSHIPNAPAWLLVISSRYFSVMKRNFRVHGFNHKTRVSQPPVDMNSSLGVELLWPLLKLIILTFKASSPKLFVIWAVFCTHRGSLSTGCLEYRLCQETMWPWVYQALLTSKYTLKRHSVKWRFFFPFDVNH